MGNHIQFEATGKNIVQVDDAFRSRVVVFECNDFFSIAFDDDASANFYDATPSGSWDQPVNLNPITFDAQRHQVPFQVRIKFSGGNFNHHNGYKYTVITNHGRLDPRICPK